MIIVKTKKFISWSILKLGCFPKTTICSVLRHGQSNQVCRRLECNITKITNKFFIDRYEGSNLIFVLKNLFRVLEIPFLFDRWQFSGEILTTPQALAKFSNIFEAS